MCCSACALVAVNPQTYPYVRFRGNDLPNHSYVDFNLVGKARDTGVECHSDLRCCEDAVNRIADWYFPNGERLSSSSKRFDIYEFYKEKNVQVRRKNGAETGGIYRCDIETLAVNNDNRATVYAGLYSSGGQ